MVFAMMQCWVYSHFLYPVIALLSVKNDLCYDAVQVLTGDSSPQGHSQQQALPEPLIQDALSREDGEEWETEGPQQRAQLLPGQQSQSQDQRERFSKMEDQVETWDASSQTNEQAVLQSAITDGLAVAPLDDKSALEMIQFYKNEKTDQDVGDFLPLLDTTSKFLQAKIVLKLIETQPVHGREIQLVYTPEQNISTFISRVDEVYEIGRLFVSEKNLIHAIISFYSAANLHRISNKSDDSVIGISNCVLEVHSVVEMMAKRPEMKNMVIDHVIPLMHEMKHYIQSISGSSRDIMVENEAQCLCDIGSCYTHYGRYNQFANMNESAIDLMKKHFNDEAAKKCIYGLCLNNAGVAYENSEEIEKSIEKYKMSLKAYEEATNWVNPEDKTDSITETENNLKRMKTKLRYSPSIRSPCLLRK